MISRLVLITIVISWSGLSFGQSPLAGTYSGPEAVTGGKCILHILKSEANSVEVLFMVATQRDDLIHMEVLTLEARPYQSAFGPDYDRSIESGRTLLADEVYDYIDYTALRHRHSPALAKSGVYFLRAQNTRRTQSRGIITFESRLILECPLLIKTRRTSVDAAKPQGF